MSKPILRQNVGSNYITISQVNFQVSFVILRSIVQASFSLQSVQQNQVPCLPWYPGETRWRKECLCCTKYSQGSSSVGIWWCSLWKVNKFWIFPPQEYTNTYTVYNVWFWKKIIHYGIILSWRLKWSVQAVLFSPIQFKIKVSKGTSQKCYHQEAVIYLLW